MADVPVGPVKTARSGHDASPAPDPGGGGALGPASLASADARTRADLLTALGGGAVAFAAYLLTLSRGVLGGDAGELQFVPPMLGLPHPTGYPLQVLLHFAWSHLPIGSVASRLNLLDAAFAAGTVSVVAILTRAAAASRAASVLAALSFAFGELWWSQAVRGDKYTLNGLFLALVLLLFVRWQQRPTDGRLALLAFAFGLSLTHHRSMLLAAPALAVGLLVGGWRPLSVRALLPPTMLVLAPLLLYTYVPWAGARGLPPGSWPVDTPAAFAEFLLDRGYTSQIRPDAAFGGRLVEEARVLLRSFGPLGVVLGLLGILVSLRRDWRLGLVLVLTFVPQAVLGASYLLESNYQLPRHWVFFLPAFLIWSVWLGLGFDAVVRAAQSRRRSHVPGRRQPVRLLVGVLVLVLGVQVGTAWVRGAVLLVRSEAGAETMDAWRQDFQRSPVAERFGRLAFDVAAADAVIVCDWEQATVLWYVQRVEGRRPDLTIRYPVERLDETLAEARVSGRTVYLSRTLPGVESRGVIASAGPLLQVYPSPEITTAPVALARFEHGLTLAGVAIHAPTPYPHGASTPHAERGAAGPPLQPGAVVPFTLYWRADAPLPDAYAISVRLKGPDGTTLAAHDERHPALGTSPTNRWTPGQVVGDYHELPLGSRLSPGTYQVQVLPYRVDPLADLRRLDAGGQTGEGGVTFPVEVQPRAIHRPLDLLAGLLAR